MLASDEVEWNFDEKSSEKSHFSMFLNWTLLDTRSEGPRSCLVYRRSTLLNERLRSTLVGT